MATYTKPTSIPRWADTSLNVTEPAEAKKNAGWVFEEIPPSSYENWKAKLNGEWWKWVDERWEDGATADFLRAVFPLEIGDADYVLQFVGGVPRVYFDKAANDWFDYDRTTNQYRFYIGGAAEYLFSASGADLQGNNLLGAANIDGSGDLTMGTITMTGFSVDADGDVSCKSLDINSGGITEAGAIGGATTIDGSGDLTMGTITMTGFSVDADGDVSCKSLDINSGGITEAGAISGATTIDGSGDLTVGTITMTGFSVDADGDVVAKSLNASSGGITNAGAIGGATTIDGSGDLTMGTITMTGFSVDADGDVVTNTTQVGDANFRLEIVSNDPTIYFDDIGGANEDKLYYDRSENLLVFSIAGLQAWQANASGVVITGGLAVGDETLTPTTNDIYLEGDLFCGGARVYFNPEIAATKTWIQWFAGTNTLQFHINNTLEYDFLASEADWNGNDLIGVGALRATTMGLDINDYISWVDNSSMKITLATVVEYEFTSAQLDMKSNNLASATNIDGSGDLTMGTITMTGFSVDSSGNVDCLSLDAGSGTIETTGAGAFGTLTAASLLNCEYVGLTVTGGSADNIRFVNNTQIVFTIAENSELYVRPDGIRVADGITLGGTGFAAPGDGILFTNGTNLRTWIQRNGDNLWLQAHSQFNIVAAGNDGTGNADVLLWNGSLLDSGSGYATYFWFRSEPNLTLLSAGDSTTSQTNYQSAIQLFSKGSPGVYPSISGNTSLYTQGGGASVEMWVVDGSNNRTQLSPHNAAGEWIFNSIDKNGKHKLVNMERLIAVVERLSGEKLMEVLSE